jgi:Porphobilinogen deaminase
MSNKIILGSRGSELSIAYANKVLSLLSNIKPGLDKEVILKTIKTSGDLFDKKKI